MEKFCVTFPHITIKERDRRYRRYQLRLKWIEESLTQIRLSSYVQRKLIMYKSVYTKLAQQIEQDRLIEFEMEVLAEAKKRKLL